MNYPLTDPIEDEMWFYHDYFKGLNYRRPIYDPFEVFQPSKSLIGECIKQLNKQCYEIINKNQSGSEEHKQLLKRIRFYKNYCSSDQHSYSPKQGITNDDIARAREYPVAELYSGKLRKSGNRFLGICPFHSETRPSFVVYGPGKGYNCFSCGQHGDSIDFVMYTQHLDFIKSVKYLCRL